MLLLRASGEISMLKAPPVYVPQTRHAQMACVAHSANCMLQPECCNALCVGGGGGAIPTKLNKPWQDQAQLAGGHRRSSAASRYYCFT